MAQKKFKYILEVVLTFTDKPPKNWVKNMIEDALENCANKVRVRSVDLE